MERHGPLARLLIRLMGLWFILDGSYGVLSNGLDRYWRIQAFHDEGMRYRPAQPLA